MDDTLILDVNGLETHFETDAGVVHSVAGVDLSLRRGETLAVVGESGSGKSVTCLSLMRLIEPPGRVVGGRALLRRKDGAVIDLVAASKRTMDEVRGDDAAMIFQEPMTSLNPLYTVGEQIAEVLRHHRGLGRALAWAGAVDLLREVRIADPTARASAYPHELSGGMRQRVMIAIALACRPLLLIADEPTTALDVTVQAQILDLLRGVKARAQGMGILFVTHNMGVVAEMADRMMVMYAGLVVEVGPVRDVFRRPRHPYTRGLLASILRQRLPGQVRGTLPSIAGNVPDPLDRPSGCPFAPRCDLVEARCREAVPPLVDTDQARVSRCLRWAEL